MAEKGCASMRNTKVATVIVCVGLGLVLLLLAFSLIRIANVDISIFATLDECDAFASKENEGAGFTKYQDASRDDKVKGLPYADYFAGKYGCDQFTFELFAYVFENNDAAQEYFERVTGKNMGALESNFSLSCGPLNASLVVVDNNQAYTVHMPTGDVRSVTQFLAEVFTIKFK